MEILTKNKAAARAAQDAGPPLDAMLVKYMNSLHRWFDIHNLSIALLVWIMYYMLLFHLSGKQTAWAWDYGSMMLMVPLFCLDVYRILWLLCPTVFEVQRYISSSLLNHTRKDSSITISEKTKVSDIDPLTDNGTMCVKPIIILSLKN